MIQICSATLVFILIAASAGTPTELRHRAESAVLSQNYDSADALFKLELSAASEINDGGIQRANALDDYALFCMFRDQNQAAQDMLSEALAIRRKLLWNGHPDLVLNLLNLAEAQFKSENFEPAADNFIEVFSTQPAAVAKNADRIFVDATKTAGALTKKANYDKAEQLYRATLSAASGAETRMRPTMMTRLGNVLALQGKNHEAAQVYQDTLKYIETNQPWNDHRRRAALSRIKSRLAALPEQDGNVTVRPLHLNFSDDF